MDVVQGTLFDERFMGRHAGAIMSDPTVALVELVANCWDAYATRVDITWPDEKARAVFSIRDNGIGMTHDQINARWTTIDYNREATQGLLVQPPPELSDASVRQAYGRNGKGRHAAFHFSQPYRIRTWRDGEENAYQVCQGVKDPIELKRLSTKPTTDLHGTEISGEQTLSSRLTPVEVRGLLSTRFLLDPAFNVSVDGVKVTFADIPKDALTEINIDVGVHPVNIKVIDTEKADRTTKQHGIAWWVKRRLVGTPSWQAFENRFLDGRREEAKRYSFIVTADHLDGAVAPDWKAFRKDDLSFKTTQEAVNEKIKEVISELLREKREETRGNVARKHQHQVQSLPEMSQERWNGMLDELVEKCPTLGETQINQVMGVLANLELAKSQYSLLEKLHKFSPSDFDDWNALLEDWTTKSAKVALDEIKTRLRLIDEIKIKTASKATDEVQELQPLFGRALWIFGPAFESMEFTSNVGMTRVIREMFGNSKKKDVGSRNRPDFIVRPDSSIGFYSIPSFDTDFNEAGINTLVVVELKRPGVPIGDEEKSQAWKYVKELKNKGYIDDSTHVTAFVLGDTIASGEGSERKEGDRTSIRPMLYTTFTGQAEKRMMNLHKRLAGAPFMTKAEPTLFDAGLAGSANAV